MITMNQCHGAARDHARSVRRAVPTLDRNSAGPTGRFEVIALFVRIILGGLEAVCRVLSYLEIREKMIVSRP